MRHHEWRGAWRTKLKLKPRNDKKSHSIFHRSIRPSRAAFHRTLSRRRHQRVSRRMTSSHGLHLKTYVLILFVIIFAPLGNVLLSKGMKNVGAVTVQSPADLGHVFVRVFSSPYIWLGIGSLLLFFVGVSARAFLGGLQFCAARFGHFLRGCGDAWAFRAERTHFAYALDRRASNMLGSSGGW